MKKTYLLTLICATFSASAMAGSTAPSPAVANPIAQVSTSAPTTSTSTPGALVNPFNGKPLSMEMLQRELETSRYQSQLLEEQIKQTAAAAELLNIPQRKAVEAAQARTQARKEEAALVEIDSQIALSKAAAAQAAAAARAAAAPAPKVVKKSAKVLAKEKADEEAAVAAAAAARAAAAVAIPRATLLSVINVGTRRSVVLDIAGNITTVADGGSSPSGAVKVLNEESAMVGTQTLKVHDQTLGRFVVSDPKPVEPGKGPIAASIPTMPAPAVPMNSTTTMLPPSIPSASGGLPPPPIPAPGFKQVSNSR